MHNCLEKKNYQKDISQQLQGYCNAITLHAKPMKNWNKKKMENGYIKETIVTLEWSWFLNIRLLGFQVKQKCES